MGIVIHLGTSDRHNVALIKTKSGCTKGGSAEAHAIKTVLLCICVLCVCPRVTLNICILAHALIDDIYWTQHMIIEVVWQIQQKSQNRS